MEDKEILIDYVCGKCGKAKTKKIKYKDFIEIKEYMCIKCGNITFT